MFHVSYKLAADKQSEDFPGGLDSKNPPAVQETWIWYLGWEDPLEEGMAT